MKKRYLISIFIIIFVYFCGYIIYNDTFPYAKPITYPNEVKINSHSISMYDGTSDIELEIPLNEVMEFIKNAKSTRGLSVNERPSTTPYYSINVETSEQSYSYYIYEESAKVYLELPYEGVYTIDNDVLKLFE